VKSTKSKRNKGAFDGGNLNDRLKTASSAKQAVLEKFKARTDPNDPAVAERRAERVAIAAAREERRAARAAEKAVREAEEARRAEEEAAKKAAAEAAEAAERERIAAEKAAQEAEEARLAAEEAARNQESEEELKARQKAARDLRYAKRKARK